MPLEANTPTRDYLATADHAIRVAGAARGFLAGYYPSPAEAARQFAVDPRAVLARVEHAATSDDREAWLRAGQDYAALRVATIDVPSMQHRGCRQCGNPIIPPGEYLARFERSWRRKVPRLVFDDGTILPVYPSKTGPWTVDHWRWFTCVFEERHNRPHYDGDCPSGPTYCRGSVDYTDAEWVRVIVPRLSSE